MRLLVAFVLVVVSLLAQETTVHLADVGVDLDLVRAKCSTKLDFKSIQEFSDFMSQFERLDEKQQQQLSSEQLTKPLQTCLSQREALRDLKQLIDNYDKKRPCKHSEVAKLEAYARRHFMVRKQRPWSLKFFTLFGVHVGLKCKLNLLAHVKQAESEVDQLDFIYSMASPTGWNFLINEHTKKTMKFGTSSNAGNSVVNRLAKLVPGLSLVDHLDFMAFDHALNDAALSKLPLESDTYDLGSADMAQQVHKSLGKIVESCQQLDQFYYNSILSLARLNELGLLASHKMLDEMHESSLMLHRWLAAASFCQLMVRVRVAESAGDNNRLELRVVHDDAQVDSRRTLYSYAIAAEDDEISEEARASFWLASVADGKWLRKDEAMFRSDPSAQVQRSAAMLRLRQFIRGLERDFSSNK